MKALAVRDCQVDTEGIGLRSKPVLVSAIAGLALPSRRTILQDRLSQCGFGFRTIESSKTLAVDLTGRDEDLLPYWSKYVAEKSARLWLPTVTDYVGSASKLWNGYAHKTVANSWFSTRLSTHPSRKWLKICSPLSTSSPVESMEGESTLRCKRIRLFPTRKQAAKMKVWCGAARWFYNQAVEKEVVNRKDVQVEMLSGCPEWAKAVPYKAKQMAIEDAAIARRNGFKFTKRTGEEFKLSFRSRKYRRDTVYLPKKAVTPKGVYPRLLGHMKSAEPITVPEYDCKLSHIDGKFYLLVPYNKPKGENQADGEVSVDPGVRTFLTFFSPDVVGKIGDLAINRIQRLCTWMDKLVSQKKWRAMRRIRRRITNLISELHHKAALWLVKNFKVIVIPPFNAQEMTVRRKRRIRSKTARQMLTLAHSRFRNILLNKAEEWNRTVVIVSEAYTSKTCSGCGTIQEIGGKKVLKCKACGREIDRDINGARGIYLRALVDTPAAGNGGALDTMVL